MINYIVCIKLTLFLIELKTTFTLAATLNSNSLNLTTQAPSPIEELIEENKQEPLGASILINQN